MRTKSPHYRNRRRKKQNKQKPVLAIIAVLAALVIGIVLCFTLRPAKTPPTDTPTPETQAPVLPTVSMPLPQEFVDKNTACEYIVLYDATNDKVLYSKNADTQCYPASTTKLLTALVTLKYTNENTVFTVGNEVLLIDPESSRAWLRMGYRLNLQTILEAIMLPSGNDAAYTAAANVGRIIAGDDSLSAQAAIAKFCEKMNETAKELGAKNSHFVNPDGIHNANHYTTASDMLLIAKAALDNPILATVMAEEKVTRTFLSGETGATWYNTNYLLRTDTRYLFEGAVGLKTGHTNEAGYCLTAAAERDGVKLVAILMNADSTSGRFEDATGLFTVCFDNVVKPATVTG